MKDILLEIKDNIATVTLNRPEFGNAFASEMYHELKNMLGELSENDNVRAVIITGSGKNFSAGGDIKRFKNLIETKTYLSPEGVLKAGAMTKAVRDCKKPVIAMINGAAAGAGCSLALACDFRVMEKSSKLAMAFINMAFPGDSGGIYYLMRTVGAARTSEILMLGKPLSSEKAMEYGLCNVLANDGELGSATLELANKLAKLPSKAIANQKKMINEFFFNELEEFAKSEAKYMVEGGKTKDHEEAVNAFLEKRKPNFTGQ